MWSSSHLHSFSVSQEMFIAMDEDDIWNDKEADMLLEYIDRFIELFDEKCYETAATHAANSPRAVLRHMEVMKW